MQEIDGYTEEYGVVFIPENELDNYFVYKTATAGTLVLGGEDSKFVVNNGTDVNNMFGVSAMFKTIVAPNEIGDEIEIKLTNRYSETQIPEDEYADEGMAFDYVLTSESTNKTYYCYVVPQAELPEGELPKDPINPEPEDPPVDPEPEPEPDPEPEPEPEPEPDPEEPPVDPDPEEPPVDPEPDQPPVDPDQPTDPEEPVDPNPGDPDEPENPDPEEPEDPDVPVVPDGPQEPDVPDGPQSPDGESDPTMTDKELQTRKYVVMFVFSALILCVIIMTIRISIKLHRRRRLWRFVREG